MCKNMLIILILTLLFGNFGKASAQSLDDIRNANESTISLTADFTQTVTNAARKSSATSEGKIYLGEERELAMLYNEPSTEIFIINDDALYMCRGGRTGLYDTTKNKPMGELSQTILGCVRGTLTELADATSSDLSFKRVGNGIEVVLKSKVKRSKWYSEITLMYDKKSLRLRRMLMREYNGNTTLYEISNHNTTEAIPSSVFDIEKHQKR